jgi:hypothetical protein
MEAEKEMSRLAGAGGAAESALMNAQAIAGRGERLCGNNLRSHGLSLQAKCGTIKMYNFSAKPIFHMGDSQIIAVIDY